jgi:hypothetical protein
MRQAPGQARTEISHGPAGGKRSDKNTGGGAEEADGHPPLARFLTTKVAALALVICTTAGIVLAATVGSGGLHGSGSARGPGPGRALTAGQAGIPGARLPAHGCCHPGGRSPWAPPGQGLHIPRPPFGGRGHELAR